MGCGKVDLLAPICFERCYLMAKLVVAGRW